MQSKYTNLQAIYTNMQAKYIHLQSCATIKTGINDS